MNIIGMAAFGAAVLVFGPGFLVQAGIGYVAGAACGAYAENRMRRLNREICRRTGDPEGNIDELAKYTAKASAVGGVICPFVPLVTLGVGMVCSDRAKRLEKLRLEKSAKEENAFKRWEAVSQPGHRSGTGVRL